MTPKELLKPRYKVIADWPNTDWKVGDIVTDFCTERAIYFYDKYPHLFKRLEWWEERKAVDMPEYVKWAHDGKIYKVFQWLGTKGGTSWLCDFIGRKEYCFLEDISISTREEYENQNK